jgi:hypothetical protein
MTQLEKLEDFASLSLDDPKRQEALDIALFKAVNAADSAKISELLQLGANPTSIQSKGRVGTTHALLIAVQNITGDGATDKLVGELLSANNINVNAADNQGNTALHVAAQRSQAPIVALFLAKGANALAKNLQENTPLHQAVSRPTSTSETERNSAQKTVQMLLTAIGSETLASGLPINKQQDSVLVKAVHQGNVDGAAAIIDYMCNLTATGDISSGETLKLLLNRKNNRGLTPLHEAFIWAKSDIIQLLVTKKYNDLTLFDVNEIDKDGNTVLHMAGDRRWAGIAPGSSLDHIATLLESGNFNVNAQNSSGDTVLHIPHISVEFADLVLKHGGDVTIRNKAGELPFEAQIRGSRAYVVDRLLQHAVESKMDMSQFESSLSGAFDKAGLNAAHLLASIDSEHFGLLPVALYSAKTQEGQLPIHIAMEEKAIKALAVMAKSASENELATIRESRDAYGNSLLHQMVQVDYLEGAQALIDIARCDVNAPNEEMDDFTDGGLPIHLAALSGSTACLSLLLARGAIIDSQLNPTQDTPLHLAVRFNKFEAAQILIDHGASKDLKNREGLTAVDEIRSLKGLDGRFRPLLVPEQ